MDPSSLRAGGGIFVGVYWIIFMRVSALLIVLVALLTIVFSVDYLVSPWFPLSSLSPSTVLGTYGLIVPAMS